VTLSLAPNALGAVLGGTTTVAATGGAAFFPDITVDRPGTFSLVASAPGLPTVTSIPFDVTPDYAVPAGVRGVTSFVQRVAVEDPDGAMVFPGCANLWDLAPALIVNDGFDDQWDPSQFPSNTPSIPSLVVNGSPFPADQTYAELTFLTPLFGVADGILPAAVTSDAAFMTLPIAGSATAVLAPLSDARLEQTIDLSTGTPPVTLSWRDIAGNESGLFPGEPTAYRVVLRDVATGVTLFSAFETLAHHVPTTRTASVTHTATIPLAITGTAVLSFEQRSCAAGRGDSNADACTGETAIDDVSVRDATGAELLANGDFETGDLTGWTAVAPGESQNVATGVRTVGGARVTRSFYTPPGALWGRFADVYENPSTTTPLDITCIYTYNLGSDGTGCTYIPTGTAQRAVSSWDTATGDRDVGIVFGAAAGVTFTSAPSFGHGTNASGEDDIRVTYTLTLAPGGAATLVQFLLMDGVDTARLPGVHDLSARAAEIDAEAQAILGGFGSDPQYTRGLTQQQLNTITNF
jgi:hypothetical protein